MEIPTLIVNMQGQVVYIEEFENKISTNHTKQIKLSKGIYFVKVSSNDFVKVEKVVVY